MNVPMENSAPVLATIYNWIHRFQKGKEGLEDHERAGGPVILSRGKQRAHQQSLEGRQPALSNKSIRNCWHAGQNSAITEHLELGTFKSAGSQNFFLNSRRKLVSKFVVNCSINYQKDKKCLERIVTGDETWIYYNQSENQPRKRVRIAPNG